MRILVIKLGALGDFIHAFHAFAAIRAHHADDRVTLLTTPPFEAMARQSPWFDEVVTDPRPPWWNIARNRRTTQLIGGFDFVYDLQTSHRSNRYFKLAGRPPWSGIAPGCSHPHANPRRDFMHTIERQREQLAHAGVTSFPVPERGWLTAQGQPPALPGRYALLVPGGAGVGDVKRWPISRYAEAARGLHDLGLTPVVIGGPMDVELGRIIRESCPQAVDLTGRTSFADLAALAAAATLALGNDTGPLHLAAASGAPTIVLFSAAGVPEQAAPRGPAGEWSTVIAEPDLGALSVERVLSAVRKTVGGAAFGQAKAEQDEKPAADRDRDHRAGGGDRK